MKRKYRYIGPKEFWAKDWEEAEQIALSSIEEVEDEEREFTDEEKEGMAEDEAYERERDKEIEESGGGD